MNDTSKYLNDDGSLNDARGMCFHISPEWLTSHGNDVKKAMNIEIYRVSDYLKWRETQPFMILHELSHAYHNTLFSTLDQHIKNAYSQAVAAGKYQAVDYVCCPGQKVKAYALTNE